jgi:hypothetical protein
MRMLRIALVLLVLASFVVASVAVSTAATVTPKAKAPAMPNATMKMPTKPAGPMMPTKKPGQMINLDQMKANIGGTYQMLKSTVKMPGAVVDAPGASVKNRATGMFSDTYGQIAQGRGKPLSLDVPAPKAISQLGGLPSLGNTMAKVKKIPGQNQMISLGL